MMITITDRVLRELDIIENVFKSQYSKWDKSNPFPYPEILDCKSDSVDGRYIGYIDIKSNVELLNIQDFKNNITTRWEKANDRSLIKNQLIAIHNKATSVVNYYNQNLTNKNTIVKEYLDKRNLFISNKQYEENEELIEYHNAVITIWDYYIDQIYLACNRGSPTLGRDYQFWYQTSNYDLANCAQEIISFIKNAEINNKSANDSKLSHRLEAIIYYYKTHYGYLPKVFDAKKIEEDYGAKRKQAIYTVWSTKGKTYKKPTALEIQAAIPHLIDFPNAKKAAVNDLDGLIKRGL